MEIILTVWGLALVYCAIEAYFFTETNPKSEEFIKNRENEHKSTN